MAAPKTLEGLATLASITVDELRAFEPADFEQLRLATSGGASLPVEVIRAFQDRFSCSILEGYGLTESTGAATFGSSTARSTTTAT
mgnify:CR=1 FL=1